MRNTASTAQHKYTHQFITQHCVTMVAVMASPPSLQWELHSSSFRRRRTRSPGHHQTGRGTSEGDTGVVVYYRHPAGVEGVWVGARLSRRSSRGSRWRSGSPGAVHRDGVLEQGHKEYAFRTTRRIGELRLAGCQTLLHHMTNMEVLRI